MKFIVYRASGRWSDRWEEEISSMKELTQLDERTGKHGLVLDFDRGKEPSCIIIYDDYIE